MFKGATRAVETILLCKVALHSSDLADSSARSLIPLADLIHIDCHIKISGKGNENGGLVQMLLFPAS